jgi:hypothetical protein
VASRIKYALESRRNRRTGETEHFAKIPLEEVLRLDARKEGIIKRIGRFFAGTPEGGSFVDPSLTSEMPTGSTLQASASRWYEQTRLEHTRQARYRDYRRMDEESGIMWKAANVIMGDAFGSPETGDQKESFAVTCDDAGPQRIIDDLVKRVQLRNEAKSVGRAAVTMGDDFEEIVIQDASKELVRVKHMPCGYVSRNEDDYGRFIADKAFTYSPGEGAESVNLTAWQVVHVRHEHRRGNLYGTSMYHGARRAFKLLHPMEEGVAIERLVNVGDKLVFYVPLPKNCQPERRKAIINEVVDSYRRRMTVDSSGRIDLSKIPIGENVDIFLGVEEGAEGRVERLSGSRANTSLADLEYFQNEMIAATGVPKAYLGLERDVNAKATLGWQDIQYARGVRVLQGEIASQFIRAVVDRQFIALGMRDVEYYVVFPAVSFVDEEVRAEIARLKWSVAQVARTGFGASTEWCLREIVGLDEEQVKTFVSSPGYEPQPVGAAGQMGQVPGARDTASVREQVAANRRLAAELIDLRHKLQAICSEGLLKDSAA